MKCLILAAGYATRLYPLTENFPKPLLKVKDKTILDWLVEDIGDAADEFVVISNHRFVSFFYEWAAKRPEPITVIDDGTNTNETRLGAVCDVRFAVDQLGIDDDCLIIAGDNLLDFSLRHFIDYSRQKGASCTMRYWEQDENRLHKCGVSEISEEEKLLSLEEKPEQPKSNWCTPPFYYYVSSDMKKIDEAIKDGCGTDAPGSLVAWMCERSPMYSMEMLGRRYDIGNLESYKNVCEIYHGAMC